MLNIYYVNDQLLGGEYFLISPKPRNLRVHKKFTYKLALTS